MGVTVRFVGSVRAIAGCGEVRVDSPGQNLGELLSHLVSRYPALKDVLFTQRDSLHPEMLFLINGRDARFLQGCDTTLNPGDIITILPVMVGG